jgi:hypothetical protein
LGIVEQNLLISGLVFLTSLIAMSSGYALLRKNLSEAARALRADHSHRNTGQTARNSYDHRQNAADLHPYPIWVTSHDRHVTWGNKAFKKSESVFVATCKHWLTIGQADGRIQAHSGAGQISWYDITAQLQDHETLWFASPVDGEVRAELCLLENALNTVTAPLIIFDGLGAYVRSSSAFQSIWPEIAQKNSPKKSLSGCLQLWQKQFLPHDALNRMRGTVLSRGDRKCWNAVLSSKKGQPFALQSTPLANRHTLIEIGPGNQPASVTQQQSVA